MMIDIIAYGIIVCESCAWGLPGSDLVWQTGSKLPDMGAPGLSGLPTTTAAQRMKAPEDLLPLVLWISTANRIVVYLAPQPQTFYQ
jgi:hypothetical protein